MQIWFNDEPLACADNLSVSALLTQLEQLQPGVALALNQHILPRDRWEDHLLQEGDRILLFQVIAGGCQDKVTCTARPCSGNCPAVVC